MVAADVARSRSRSRSPAPAVVNGKMSWPKDSAVQFFHAADPSNLHAQYVCTAAMPGPGPKLLQSHGWLDGTLLKDFSPEDFQPMKKDTWPLILPSPKFRFTDRSSGKAGTVGEQRRVHMHHLRKPAPIDPLLSLVFVRWGGEDAVSGPNDNEESNDGDWGTYGCPASDDYMSAVVRQGLMMHPRLMGEGKQFKFEIFSLFVKDSKGAQAIAGMCHWMESCLKGKKRSTFWMMWPSEWDDFRGSDYAAYIERHAFFGAIRACEQVGIRTGFPHPADQYEMITSKTWMATLSLQPQARLPAATMVSKGNVLSDPKAAAKNSLAMLAYIRSKNPFPVADGEQAAPSVINKNGVVKGVVKLGWSWEARFIKIFNSEEDLGMKLTEILTEPGCRAGQAIVQEWVDFDFEMRLYFIPPDDWSPPKRLEPTRIECNAWSGSMENGERRNFHKLTKETVLADYWKQDEEAYNSARKQAIETSQFLIAWLLLNNAEPVPYIRLDFMLLRLGPGKARVIFGEYCEMGACSLGWEEGPPTLWKAALDSALK